MPAKSARDIAWLAGLLDGEGSFSVIANGSAPGIKLGMKDKDIVERAALLMSNGKYMVSEVMNNKQPFYITRIWGRLAIEWMLTIYTLMGERRKERIKFIVNLWKSHIPGKGWHGEGDVCRRGHHIIGSNIKSFIYQGHTRIRCKICSLKGTRFSPTLMQLLCDEQRSYITENLIAEELCL